VWASALKNVMQLGLGVNGKGGEGGGLLMVPREPYMALQAYRNVHCYALLFLSIDFFYII